jgi:hypothetical protein
VETEEDNPSPEAVKEKTTPPNRFPKPRGEAEEKEDEEEDDPGLADSTGSDLSRFTNQYLP